MKRGKQDIKVLEISSSFESKNPFNLTHLLWKHATLPAGTADVGKKKEEEDLRNSEKKQSTDPLAC